MKGYWSQRNLQISEKFISICGIAYRWVVRCCSLSAVLLSATPWTAAHLSFSVSRSLLKLMSIESMMDTPVILCHPLLLPSIFSNIRIFSRESVLPSRWPKCWRLSFSLIPSSEYSGLISFRIDWFDLWEFSHRSPQIPCRSFGPVQNIHKTFGLHQKMSANPQSTQE